ncbi:putative Zn-binding protein involved in type VI secretion [Luteibacter sp. Sphag1AF]|uniref:PAAR domain-containing protein n=1 Tax=Luteibacter sp. Sphag1AF TaxID=2587031 RepID=UPI0016200740|nr:PAAR domain-containing protein [Luteibacter sp. Sphag1AF]MBB3229113.1 putative Zn-binding protein involved in type VI secretion [Luteibacter sp. Sphag1AF]
MDTQTVRKRRRPIVVVGDTTTHGGQVISGCPVARLNGRAVARVGDKVLCPRCRAICTIMAGDLPPPDRPRAFAVHGDATSCGARLMSSLWACGSSDVMAPVRAATSRCIAAPADLTDPAACLRFRVCDMRSGKPVADVSYVLPRKNGGEAWHYTDEYGLTIVVPMTGPERPSVYFEFGMPEERQLETVALDFVPAERLLLAEPRRRRRGRPRRELHPPSL